MARLGRILPATLTAGIAYIAGGEAINLLLSLASFVLTTRLLSKADYGIWATVLDAVSIVAGLAAFGLPLAAIQAVAAEDGSQYVVPALLLRLLTTGVAGLLVLVAIALSTDRGVYGLPGLLAVPGLLASGLTAACEEILRARKQFRRAATLENVARATQVLVIVVIAIVYKRGSTARPGVALLVAAWSATWAAGLLAGLSWVRPERAFSPDTLQALRRLGRAAPLLGVVTLVALLRFRVEVVLLGLLRSSVEAAQFAVAARVYTIALVVPKIVVAVLFPYLLHARGEGVPGLQGQVTRLFLLVIAAGAVISAGLVLTAPVVVRRAAGSGYDGSATPARLLALLIVPGYLSAVLTILLVERRRTRIAAVALFAPAVVAYLLELVLVGRFGETVCIVGGSGAVLASCLIQAVAAKRCGILRLPGATGSS